jgi:PTS system cellobiose-specific IIB component
MKKITLVCAAGMSTSLLVAKMKESVEQMNEQIEIRAVAESAFSNYAADTDILLLGPQVAYKLKQLKETYESKGIKIAVINSMDYGMMNGKKVLETALSL